MAIWRKRRPGEDRPRSVDPTSRPDPAGSPGSASPRGPRTVIDLRDDLGLAASLEVDPSRRSELAERLRQRRAQAEAAEDLQRLRARHWSGERIIEESRLDTEWWAHSEADPHAVLGLIPGASLEEAAAARRRVAKECHPDADHPLDADRDAARQRMIAANAAYDRIRRALRV